MRRYRHAALLALIAAAAALQGCIALIGAGAAGVYSSLEDRRSTGMQIDDEGIEVRAANRIGDSLRERAHVNVTAYNRSVLVTGEAWDEAAREEIGRIVSLVPNVKNVTNEVQVGALSSLAARTGDSSVTTKVRARFLNVKEFNPVHIKVVTEAGVVYLLGIVTEKEAEAATEIARTTAGVRKVVRLFEYCTPDDDPCRRPPPSGRPAR